MSSLYGIGIELNTIGHSSPVDTTIVRPNGTTYVCRTMRSEKPGKYFHPAIATLICGGGRLLLALVMRLVDDAGGTFTHCDTDSLAIVATPNRQTIACEGGPVTDADGQAAITAISHDDVTGICERINALNPYDRDLIPDLLKIEHDSLNRPIRCWSIASKRYALYIRTEDGGIELVDRKEHGLGHLISPIKNRTEFYDQVWLEILNIELGLDQPEPDWSSLPAIGRLALTTLRELKNFHLFNEGKPYRERIRPYGFLSTSHLHPRAIPPGSTGRLIAPVGTPPEQPDWLNPNNPTQLTAITTADAAHVIDGHAPVKTLRQFLSAYRLHPESKANGPDGKPCGPRTSGLLQPRHIHAQRLIRCGKEANRYTDTPTTSDPTNQITQYPEPLCEQCGSVIDHRNGRRFCNDTCRKQHARAHPAT